MSQLFNLSEHAFLFSVSPRRQSLHRRLFRAAGLALPTPRQPLKLDKATRSREPAAYSGLALNFIEALFEAYRAHLPYVLFYEDDAAPCPNAQQKLDALLAANPLPDDCGILCLGDMNGVSIVRGKQTLLLKDCASVYTPLVSGKAENKGSHALLIRHAAMLPYIQAIIENGVTDLATSRISRYGDCRAYGLFHHPLFLQHRFDSSNADQIPYRTPECFAGNTAAMRKAFPRTASLTRFSLPKPAKRFLVFSNAPKKDLSSLELSEDDDVVVLLNRAVDEEGLGACRKILLCRRNADKPHSWFLPSGSECLVAPAYEDFLVPTDEELASERTWFREYRASGMIPSTGWVTWKLLQEDYPDAEIVLVDFKPDGNIGTYKWPKHDWQREARDYRADQVKRLSLTDCK